MTSWVSQKRSVELPKFSVEPSIASSASVESDTSEESSKRQFGSKLAKRHSRAITCLRMTFITIAVLAAAGLASTIYTMMHSTEQQDFEDQFEAQAWQLLDAATHALETRMAALELLAFSFTSYATSQNQSWPFVMLPHFEEGASKVMELSNSLGIVVAPWVTTESRANWQTFSLENQEWAVTEEGTFEDATAVDDNPRYLQGGGERDPQRRPDFSQGFSSSIYGTSPIGLQTDTSTGPFLPGWQSSPVSTRLVNFNLLSGQTTEWGIQAALQSGQASLSNVDDLNGNFLSTIDVLDDWENNVLEKEADQIASMAFPIMSSLQEGSNQTLVGSLMAFSHWSTLFRDVLRDGVGIHVLLENECTDSYTYRIDGPQVAFEGRGLLHDRHYEDMSLASTIVVERIGVQLQTTVCPYKIRIVPSKITEEGYKTNKPLLFMTMVFVMFLLAVILFVLYDFMVGKRQRQIEREAADNQKIVSSLFPQAFRERMFQRAQNEEDKKKAANLPIVVRAAGQSAALSSLDDQDFAALSKDPDTLSGSMRLKSYLKGGLSNSTDENVPIADLFSNCSVFFGDIANFTAWASARDPAQVFFLLQSLYSAMDKLAKKLGVFKIETIGDCYMAATGLPEPQADHAVRLARFARECLYTMNNLLLKLELSLGPDTADLNLRVGIHSGPVTAGVLMGEKSRFQLFGDTVNTAARMESTGEKGRIQVSVETAELLRAAGKGMWLSKRKDAVYAKGKGQMNTFWLLNRVDNFRSPAHSRSTDVNAKDSRHDDAQHEPDKSLSQRVKYSKGSPAGALGSEDSTGSSAEDTSHSRSKRVEQVELQQERQKNDKRKRLVDWHVAMLEQLLQRIIATRQHQNSHMPNRSNETIAWTYQDRQVADDVAEIISFPQVDARTVHRRVSTAGIELPQKAQQQLRDFIATVASMYRETNPFHDFEHASHVTMSTNKLFNGVITPAWTEESELQEKEEVLAYTRKIKNHPLTHFAVVLSAVIHDVDHTGVSNNDLVQTKAEVAAMYNGKSVAEQNSVDVAWCLLMDPAYSDLQQCIYQTKEELDLFRQIVVNMVMATDIFDKDAKAFRERRWQMAFGDTSSTLDPEDLHNLRATVMLEHTIQASDVVHTMQHWQIFRKWNERLFHEMVQAFQNNISSKDPTSGWYEGEIMFFDFYVIPLAHKLIESGAYGVAADEYLEYSIKNRAEWAAKGKNAVREMASKYHTGRLLSSFLTAGETEPSTIDVDDQSGSVSFCSAA